MEKSHSSGIGISVTAVMVAFTIAVTCARVYTAEALATDPPPTMGDGGIGQISDFSKGTKVLSFYKDSEGRIQSFSGSYMVYGYISDRNITGAKSSNTKVATVKTIRSGSSVLLINPKRQGKTTVSYRLAGKRHHVVVKFYWYKQPFQSIKFGKELIRRYNYKKYGLTISALATPRVKMSGHIKITCKPNWKVEKISVSYGKNDKIKVLRNGEKLPGKTHTTSIDFRNTKSKQLISLSFDAR